MVELPERFKQRIKEQLGEEYEAYLQSFQEKSRNGLRVNTGKLSAEEFKQLSPFGLQEVPWVPNGFIYEGERPAVHPYYYAGLYYLQEPSAMTPASLLPVEPGDKVLDLCAAPGGKSTELAARLQGEGVLVSNDISNSRAKALLKNLELFGARNILVVSEAPNKLCEYFNGYFDKILVDAPCSGEGMFRKSPAIMKNWEQYGTEYYHKLQQEILPQAVAMLKPGGYLLYSTCTFSPEENEGSVQEVLDAFPEMKLVDALPEQVVAMQRVALAVNEEQRIANTDKEAGNGVRHCNYTGFDCGHPEWIENGSEELKKTIRLWPHKIAGEGHFIALFRKDTDAEATGEKRVRNMSGKPCALSEETEEFLAMLKIEIPRERLQIKEERLYLLPELGVDTKGLRLLRSGLFLGEMKKKRFEPSQALACALHKDEYANRYDLAVDDPDVIRYLKCESIEIKKPCKDGWVLVTVEGFPLGWGKYSKGSFKNRYLPGWRLM